MVSIFDTINKDVALVVKVSIGLAVLGYSVYMRR